MGWSGWGEVVVGSGAVECGRAGWGRTVGPHQETSYRCVFSIRILIYRPTEYVCVWGYV